MEASERSTPEEIFNGILDAPTLLLLSSSDDAFGEIFYMIAINSGLSHLTSRKRPPEQRRERSIP